MGNKYVTIRIAENSVLGGDGAGHVLVYSKDGDYYYSVLLSDLFIEQNRRIAKMEKEFTEKEAEYSKKFRAAEEEIGALESRLEEADSRRDAKVSSMISNYQESMNKVFDMIGLVQEGESNNG